MALIIAGCGTTTPSPAPPEMTEPTPFLSPSPSAAPSATSTPLACTPVPSATATAASGPTARLPLKLVTYSDRDGDNEIYLLDCSSGEIRQLTDNSASDCFASWSPDGERIAFVSDRDGNQEIYTMSADGSEVERLTDNPAPDLFPAWSPDSGSIAFFSRGEKGDNLWLMELAAGHRRPLTSFEDGTGGTMTFSPDGSKIFFGFERMKKYKIYMLELPGGEPKEIITHARPESRLSCISDPEGMALLYVSGKGNQEDIWLSYVGDGRFQHITKNTAPDHSPTLSPDGQEVVFSSRRNGNNWQLYTVSRKGKPSENAVRRITNDGFNYYYPDVK